jgi:tRNA 5-methylaminomethyl-2-thiouridine biosynthesis bifunctional protein
LLGSGRNHIVCHFGREAMALEDDGVAWRVLGARGETIAAAPTLILAGAHEIDRFRTIAIPSLVRVRGQVTYLPAAPSRRLGIVVCGDGYVAPLPGGGHCVGATFQPEDADTTPRVADHAENLARLERMLPGFGRELRPGALTGRAALRAATADRLPACGSLEPIGNGPAAAPRLLVTAGLGARGLIWAPLCAEVLAARLNGEPNPIERRLLQALDPQRLAGRGPRD